MFTIEATVDEIYQVAASKSALHEFFAKPENFVRYMPEIISNVVPQGNDQSRWTLKIDVKGSTIKVDLNLTSAKTTESLISYEPLAAGADRLAIRIKLSGTGNQTSVQFLLELRLQRKSSFDIHPLAGLLGERAISKITQSHAAELVETFVKQAEKAAKKAG